MTTPTRMQRSGRSMPGPTWRPSPLEERPSELPVPGTAAIAAVLGLPGLEWACQAPWGWEETMAVEVELREAVVWPWPKEAPLAAERPLTRRKRRRAQIL